MPKYSQNGIPELVSGASSSSALSTAVDDRVMGIPRSTPQNSFVGLIVLAWRNITLAAYSMIDTVNRKVSHTDDATAGGRFNTAATGGAASCVLTATDATQATSEWSIDDVANLDSVLGGDHGKGVWYGSLQGQSKSLEAVLNALVNEAAKLGVNVVVAANQTAGTVTIGKYASDSAQTTACNTARGTIPSSPAVFVTHEVQEITAAAPSAGPNFGL